MNDLEREVSKVKKRLGGKVGYVEPYKMTPGEQQRYWNRKNKELNRELVSKGTTLAGLLIMPLGTKLIGKAGAIVVKNPALRRAVGKVITPKQVRWAKRMLKNMLMPERASLKGYPPGSLKKAWDIPNVARKGRRWLRLLEKGKKVGIKWGKGGATSEDIARDILKTLADSLRK